MAKALNLFPFEVNKDSLFEAEVVSQPNEHGVKMVIYKGPRVMAQFIAISCNRRSNLDKALLSQIIRSQS